MQPYEKVFVTDVDSGAAYKDVVFSYLSTIKN